ncbi:pentatricopeptide repeat-containing protein At4g39952, mitochondrial [Neltuma alba]|uniref:pentatricopeptide repeat-containing protein At4g39952, mitochondrial n=1 Tax=Neltuma alba TaxID=207710 RepID=UPI0010A3A38E|nr:pentatricopeptide repeat-containing protein At4g39952, mitochondrial-like [Prosopis alba]
MRVLFKVRSCFVCKISSALYSSHSPYLPHQLTTLSTKIPTFQSLLQFHAITVTTGNSNNVFVASKLISLYDSFNHPTSSTMVFHSLDDSKDVFAWNSIVKCHFSHGNFSQALSFYSQMRESAVLPNGFTIPMVVSACAELMLLDYAKNVHGLAAKLGLLADGSAVGSSFVSLYSRCGQLDDASHMFEEIPVKDVVAWTALAIGYVQNEESEKGLNCLCEMHRIGEVDVKPNFRTLEGGFQACGNLGALSEGRCLHGLALKSGVGCSQVVQSSILSMYCKCGIPQEAYQSFCQLINKDLLSWTSVIGNFARFGLMTKCIRFFYEMQEKQIYPDGIVICCILLGFSNSMNISEAKAFHGLIVRRYYVFDEIVHNTLLSMYCKFGMLSLAERLFHGDKKSLECWNSMVIGYGRIGRSVKCIETLREMQHLGIHSESKSLVSAIASCTQLGATKIGRSIHCNVIKNFMDVNVSVANSLIDMYGKCGKMAFARRIFDRMERDVVSWNALLSSLVPAGHHQEAIDLFNKMVVEEQKPNTATLVVILSACSHLASLEEGVRVHHYLNERGFELNVPLGTALVDMYAKCGQLERSKQMFDSMEEKDVVCWNAMISGYGMNGYAESAVDLFQRMEKANVKPNEITFLALLTACAHAGLVEEGKHLFARMRSYSMKPNLKHYTCMVDLLGRSGNLQEAEALVLSMPISPDGGVWGAILSACKTHNQIEMGIRIAQYAVDSDPVNDGYYVTLANMYSSIGKWEEAENVRRMMIERCSIGKKAGWSML